VLSRNSDGCRATRQLIRDSHESPKAKGAHRRRAWQLFRSLLDRKIVEFIPRAERAEGDHPDRKLRVHVDLQDDFSMDQALSLYLIETVPTLDPAAPDYALDLLTLVESILEDPDIILRKQLDRVKSQAMADMKARGLEYQERMDELEKLEYPKPNRDFIYSTFNAFADKHPWVGQENIRPKSIAREMFEQFRSFGDYIRDYELQRSEGLLLRHLNSVFKVLAQTVPDAAQTDPVREMDLYLSAMIRQVDSRSSPAFAVAWSATAKPPAERWPSRPKARPPPKTRKTHGHPTAWARRSNSTSPSTNKSASIRTRVTRGTRMFCHRKTNGRGGSSRCSSTPRNTTIGWPSSTSI